MNSTNIQVDPRLQRVGGPNTNTGRRPVDPRYEGRCLRCLVRDHTIMTCREPMKCRLCLQGGHCPASCPMKVTALSLPAARGLYACLVGEIRAADSEWSHIVNGLRELSPDLKDPDCHRLTSGDVFLRGLTKEAWRLLQGRSQRLPGGEVIKWRRPRPTDGALAVPIETRRLEICGIPFGMRSWVLLAKIL